MEAELSRVPDYYIERLKEQITTFKAMLEPLESGKIVMGDRDKTIAWIIHLKKTIAMYREVVDFKDA